MERTISHRINQSAICICGSNRFSRLIGSQGRALEPQIARFGSIWTNARCELYLPGSQIAIRASDGSRTWTDSPSSQKNHGHRQTASGGYQFPCDAVATSRWGV